MIAALKRKVCLKSTFFYLSFLVLDKNTWINISEIQLFTSIKIKAAVFK